MSKPVTVHVDFHAQPDKAQALREWLETALPMIHGAEGCSGARLLQSATDATHLRLVEHWSSIERHEAYVGELVGEGKMDEVMALASAPPATSYYEARS